MRLEQVEQALAAYEEIPLRFVDVDLDEALALAAATRVSAYDAHVVVCARQQRAPLLSLDAGQLSPSTRRWSRRAARNEHVLSSTDSAPPDATTEAEADRTLIIS